MTHSVFAALQAIEQGAQRATVQELRLMVKEVSALRLFCVTVDEGECTDALRLKLFRLIEEQEVPGMALRDVGEVGSLSNASYLGHVLCA